MLDWLVGRAILAHRDRVVRVDVHDRQAHQRREPQWTALEVGKDEEACLEGTDSAQCHAVRRGLRRGLAHAEVQVSSAVVGGLEVPAPGKVSRVLVDGARSLAPPTSDGTRGAMAFITIWLATRPATGPSAGENLGSSSSQPSGSAPAASRSSSAESAG